MWRHFASNMVTLLIVATFLLGGLILWGQSKYKAAGPLETQICLRVAPAPGSALSRVSRTLEAEGAISSGTLFRVGMAYSDKAGRLKAGSYLVPPGSSMAQIADIITRGGASTCGTEVVYRIGVTRDFVQVRSLDPATGRYREDARFDPKKPERPEAFTKVRKASDTRYRIAVAEGVTSWQVVDALSRVDVLKGKIEATPAEGAMAPESYEVKSGDSRAAVVKRMTDLQARRVAEVWAARQGNLPLKSAAEMVTLASIIEKETGISTERGQVASVFTNRLRKGMKLQTDPTVIYGITKGQGVLGRGLRRSELRRETPWNTYVIPGLPPTPIANPGLASLKAAVAPETTDYLFFVAKTLNPRDGHAFAATLAEHNRNVARYREAERAAE